METGDDSIAHSIQLHVPKSWNHLNIFIEGSYDNSR